MERSSNDVHDDAEDEQVLTKQENKSLLRSEALYKYILETSVYPREPEALRELRLITAEHPWNVMAASADEVQFLGMLLRMINAKRTLEIGVFTSYSLLATALAIPEDGTILAIDVDRQSYELGLPVIEKAGVAHKIDFREGKALAILDELVNKEKYKGVVRLCVCGRGQGQLLELPRAGARAGEGGRCDRVRQHAVGRLGGGGARRTAAVVPQGLQGLPRGAEQGAGGGPAHRDLPALYLRRPHSLSPTLLGATALCVVLRGFDLVDESQTCVILLQ